MNLHLVYPPCCDPTAPYISLPVLTGYLRGRGVEVSQLDANAGAFAWLLRDNKLAAAADRVRLRLKALGEKPSLNHPEALEYVTLDESLGEWKLSGISVDDAVRILRHPVDFYDYRRYGAAVDCIEKALALLSASYYPLRFSFSGYRKPFSLLNCTEMAADALPENNPFDEYYRETVFPWVEGRRPAILGVSAAFTSQLQPALSLAALLRNMFPNLTIVLGGSAATQFFLTMPETLKPAALKPFDAVVLFEGEETLYEIAAAAEKGERPSGVIHGRRDTDISALPPPDFEGLNLGDYLSPAIVPPYDAARGCYWGGCAFCHYGLTEKGTAKYRERGGEKTAKDLRKLQDTYGWKIFYLSEDTISPKTLAAMARHLSEDGASGLSGGGPSIRWATDIRGEKTITPDMAGALKAGGCLALSVGLESGSDRVLKLIDKGINASDMEAAVKNLAFAGIAVEIMCFSGFPTETFREAMETIKLIERNLSAVSLFMFGEFKLMAGSRIAENPDYFGIRELYRLKGDDFHTELMFIPHQSYKTNRESEKLDRALKRLSARFTMKFYPYAGSLSTAHTLLWYDHFGPDAFKQTGRRENINERESVIPDEAWEVLDREEEIWRRLLFNKRTVSRQAYTAEASRLPLWKSF